MLRRESKNAKRKGRKKRDFMAGRKLRSRAEMECIGGMSARDRERKRKTSHWVRFEFDRGGVESVVRLVSCPVATIGNTLPYERHFFSLWPSECTWARTREKDHKHLYKERERK